VGGGRRCPHPRSMPEQRREDNFEIWKRVGGARRCWLGNRVMAEKMFEEWKGLFTRLTVQAAALLLLMTLGCGSRVICGSGETGPADPGCVGSQLHSGDRVSVVMRDGAVVRGIYAGVTDANGGSVVILSPTAVALTTDTVQVDMREISRVETPRYLSPEGMALLLVGFVALAGFVWALSSFDLGIR